MNNKSLIDVLTKNDQDDVRILKDYLKGFSMEINGLLQQADTTRKAAELQVTRSADKRGHYAAYKMYNQAKEDYQKVYDKIQERGPYIQVSTKSGADIKSLEDQIEQAKKKAYQEYKKGTSLLGRIFGGIAAALTYESDSQEAIQKAGAWKSKLNPQAQNCRYKLSSLKPRLVSNEKKLVKLLVQ